MTAQGGVEGEVEAMRLGALDYLVKPFDLELLALVMQRARKSRQKTRMRNEEEHDFFFDDTLTPIRNRIEKIIAADIRLGNHLPPVLILLHPQNLWVDSGSGRSPIV